MLPSNITTNNKHDRKITKQNCKTAYKIWHNQDTFSDIIATSRPVQMIATVDTANQNGSWNSLFSAYYIWFNAILTKWLIKKYSIIAKNVQKCDSMK